ncbi:MAG: SpoIIE family protein phosphatase [Candidatus Wallbacteria bacterium]|nr:SpoIIE family protein phosphatase [Candidatus Wallbacteria bacterium]
MIKILLIDDDQDMLMLLKQGLSNLGFPIITAASAEEGQRLFLTEDFSILITDWMMPETNGIDFIRWVRQQKRDSYTYIILLTAKTDKEALVEGLDAGANEFVSKPVLNFSELRLRVSNGARIINLEQSLLSRNNELNSLYKQIKNDVVAAARVQKSLLPNPELRIPGISFSQYFRPSEDLAGDIFNIFPISDHEIAFYLADVSGHGVAASLLSVMISNVLTPGRADIDLKNPGSVAEALNKRFQLNMETQQYFTLSYGVLNLPDRSFQYVSAGHSGILKISGESVNLLQATGTAIGLFPDTSYINESMTLLPGDRLLFFSDGLTDVKNSQNAYLNSDKLISELSNCTGSTDRQISCLIDLALMWGGNVAEDDISILAVEIPGLVI